MRGAEHPEQVGVSEERETDSNDSLCLLLLEGSSLSVKPGPGSDFWPMAQESSRLPYVPFLSLNPIFSSARMG